MKAARAYVSEKDPLPSMMGVFGIDLAFTPYAPFTKDREALQKALDTIETRASATFGMDREQKARIESNAATTQQQAEQRLARTRARPAPTRSWHRWKRT